MEGGQNSNLKILAVIFIRHTQNHIKYTGILPWLIYFKNGTNYLNQFWYSRVSLSPSPTIFSLSGFTCKFFRCYGKKECYIKRREVVSVNQLIVLLSTYYCLSIPELCNPTMLSWTFYRACGSHLKSSKPMTGKHDSPDHCSSTVEGTRESQP